MESLKKSPEKLAKEFEECIKQRMAEIPNLTREAAEMICMPSTKPTDEPTPPGAAGYKFLSGGPSIEASEIVTRRFQMAEWEREYQESIGETSTESIRDYWARAKRRQRIREQLEDTTHPEELDPHERCVRAVMEIEHLTRPQAELRCVEIEKGREDAAKQNLTDKGEVDVDDLMASCIVTVMATQSTAKHALTTEEAKAICERIMFPEEFIEEKGLVVLPSILTEDMFVEAVERRLELHDYETMKEASQELLKVFGTDMKFALLWKQQLRNEKGMAMYVSFRMSQHDETKEEATKAVEKDLLFVDFPDDNCTAKLQKTIWDFIEKQTYLRTRLYGVSERASNDWVKRELMQKGLLTSRDQLPAADPVPVGDLFRKNARQIRAMGEQKDKSGLNNMYLTKPYTLKRDEDNDQLEQLEACITLHMEKEGMSREEARKHCLEDLEHSGLPEA